MTQHFLVFAFLLHLVISCGMRRAVKTVMRIGNRKNDVQGRRIWQEAINIQDLSNLTLFFLLSSNYGCIKKDRMIIEAR